MKKYKENAVLVFMKPFLIILCLVSATLLLVQLPALYFEKADAQLLMEQGQSEYMLKSVLTEKIFFEEKLDVFLNSGKGCWFGEPEVWDEETDRVMEKALADEMELLLNGLYAPITIALREEVASSVGCQVRIIYTEEDRTYSWEMGMLTFDISEIGWRGMLVFDVESNKIFLLRMECLMCQPDNGFIEMDDSGSWIEGFEAYYDGVKVWHKFEGICDQTYVLLEPIMSNDKVMEELGALYDKLCGVYEEPVAEKVVN